MLEFILGRAGSGKTTELTTRIQKATQAGNRVFLFVPEQFTFETERKYYRLLGAKQFHYVQVSSFSRLAHNLFKEYGGVSGDYADDSKKLILMNLALHQIKDQLQVYAKASQNIRFSQSMVELVQELKNADCDFDQFELLTNRLPDGLLKLKSQDIALIYDVYTALMADGYKDASDDLSRAGTLIEKHDYFRDSMIFVDEFKGFTEKEYRLLTIMLKQAKSVTTALCTDAVGGENNLFYSVNQTYQDLIRLAKKEHISVGAPTRLETNYRFQNDALSWVESQVFQGQTKPFEGENKAVHAVVSANEYDEVDYVLATIRELIEKEGYRCRDIVIFSRDLESYRSCLETTFEKYKLSYYFDERKPITVSPLVRFVERALDLVTGQFSSDSVLALFKCGMTAHAITDIAVLENYAYLWDLKRADWEQDFTLSIFGATAPRNEKQRQEQTETLAMLNNIRHQVMTALTCLRKTKDGTAMQMSQGVLEFLEQMGVREQINQRLSRLDLNNTEDLNLADEYKRLWEIVGKIVDILAKTIGNRPMTLARYTELFRLVCANFDMGTVPQAMDSVTIGSPERTRTESPKVVFVLGANDKVFPFIPDSGQVYTDAERRELIESMELSLSRPLQERMKEERFIAYQAMCTPSEKLYLTARKADIKGTTMSLSNVYTQLNRMFGESCMLDTDDLNRLYFCKTKAGAFSVLAYQFRQDDALTASLKEYFSCDSLYAQRMETIARNFGKKEFKLKNREQIKSLFGQNVLLSPSKIEKFSKCKFSYFCEFGMGLKKREKVQLNALSKGTIVHNVLYRVCTQITDFSVFEEEKILPLVRDAIDEMIATMGGQEHQTSRFLYLYERVERNVVTLLKRLFDELHHSLFLPSEFEYQIGGENGLAPYTTKTAEGMSVTVQGIVDRIDAYTDANGQRFLRIIDYKTGTKEFRLSDIINGLNLQMFLYLLCLERNGKPSFGDFLSAGALYMPASELEGSLERHASEDTVQDQVQSHYRMKGVVLDDEPVVRAMEPELNGVYTPISPKATAYDKNNELKKDVFVNNHVNEQYFSASANEVLLTREQLGKLFRTVERVVGDMAEELYGGHIEAKPLEGACQFCDYKNLCGFEEGDSVRAYIKLKKKEIFDYLETQEQNETGVE